MITGLHHVSLIVADTQRALDFYCRVLGFSQIVDRPDLAYPGAWLDCMGQQLHLLELPNPYQQAGRPAHGGQDRHIAFSVDNFAQLQQQLDSHNIIYMLSRSGRKALFCRDPDANALEFIGL